jgi:hypothetical protein
MPSGKNNQIGACAASDFKNGLEWGELSHALDQEGAVRIAIAARS